MPSHILTIAGIDPGISGAIIGAKFADGLLLDSLVLDIPSIKIGSSRRVEPVALMETMIELQGWGTEHVFMEQLHAMPPPRKGRPGRGTVAAWSLALTCGQLEQAIVDRGLAYTLVTPQRWKSALRITAKGTDGKEQARQRALQLFPEARSWLYRVKDSDRAEAMLIAEWGRRSMDGQFDG